MDKRSKYTPLEMEVLACMRALLRPIPRLMQWYSPRAILLAMLTHAGVGLRDQLAEGKLSRAEVSRACRDLRGMALGQGSGKSSRKLHDAVITGAKRAKPNVH